MTQRPARGLAGLAALLACAVQPPAAPAPPSVAAAPAPIPLTPITPLPLSNAPVMVFNRIVDPYTGETLAALPVTNEHQHARPGEQGGQFWVGSTLYDIATRTAVRTLSEEFSLDNDHTSVLRRDADGKQLWSYTPDEGVVSHVLNDDVFVYVAIAGGIAVLDRNTGALQHTLTGPHRYLTLYAGLVVALDDTLRWLLARDPVSGREVFRVALPAAERHEHPVVVGDDLLVRAGTYSLLLDRRGAPRFRLAEHIIDLVPAPAGWFVTTDTRLLALTHAGKQAWELRSFDGYFLGNTRLMALPGGDLLINNFSHVSDSGVTVIRLDANGRQRWRTYCQDVGVIHFEYYHVAYVALRGEDLVVVSQGSSVAWIELLDARTGASKQRLDVD